ncbi:MAG: hypothetical protein V7696_19025 [Halioglobus sp.]
MLVPAIAWAQADSTVPEPATAESVEAKAATPEDQIGGWQPLAPDEEEILEEIQVEHQEEDVNWVDDSHAYVTDQAQALTEWMDEYFGDANNDLEKAESLLRLEVSDDWESEDGHDLSVRLRGKLQMPRISRRLNLVFSGDDADTLDEEDRESENQVALQYQLGEERTRSRIDLTMGIASGNLRPGVKYRNEAPIDERHSYRFLERLQYEDGEGFFSISQLDLNRVRDEDSVWRWSNRGEWGEHTDGVEWRTRLSLRKRYNPDSRRPYAINYFGTIRGVTRPDSYVKNYRVGLTWRKQVYRDFLFMELEPTYNYRRPNLDEDRAGVWGVEVRFEIALERDLRRMRKAMDPQEADDQEENFADPYQQAGPATSQTP